MHACMAYLLALKHQKMCLSRASRTCATSQRIRKWKSPPRKTHMSLSFWGCFTDRWGIGIYEIECYMLRRFEKKMQVSFFDLPSSLRCRSFYEMVYEMRGEREAAKKSGRRDRIFYGERKAWRVGLCGSGNFTLSPRYKVCTIERERDFIFIFAFIYLFIYSKRASMRH